MESTFFFSKMYKEVEIKMNYESWLTFMSVLHEVASRQNDAETIQNAKDFLIEWKKGTIKHEWETY